MTTNPDDHDDKLFDRVVDGELSTAERQQLLASLDDRDRWADGNGWRRCALAFLESQAWGTQLKQWVSEPMDRQADAVVLPPFAESGHASESSWQAGRWFAVAASLLLAFSLGWLTNTAPSTPEQPTPLAVTDEGRLKEGEMQREESPLRDALPAGADNAVTLVVRDASGKQQRLQLPLLEAGDLDQRFAGQWDAALPAKLREGFRDRGFDVQRRRRFAPMFFEQNEELVPMVVPVDDTTIVPVSRPVY